jgi:hypothetical protein
MRLLWLASLIVGLGACANGQVDPFPDDDGGTMMQADSGTKSDGAMGSDGSGCSSPMKVCNGVCVDTVTDPKNCGGCNKPCPDPEGGTATCMSGMCGGSCMAPKVLCPDGCTDTKTDPNNCGMCSNACMMTETCQTGICCAMGQVNCSNMCTDTMSDDANCGGCGKPCMMGLSCVGGMCTNAPPVKVGNYTVFGSASSHSPNYLLGSQITVPKNGKLLKFGLISKSSGANVIMALYTDNNGNPASLVASTSQTALNNSDQQIAPNVQANLTQGKYWIMAEYNVNASVGIDYSMSSAIVMYISHTFGSALPANFPAPTSYTGQRFNYYIVMQ